MNDHSPTPQAEVLPVVTRSAPETIYLVIGEDCPADASFDQCEEVTWCQDDIDGNGIKYVRADSATAREAELTAKLSAAMEDADRLDWFLRNPNEVLEGIGGWFRLDANGDPTFYASARCAIDSARAGAVTVKAWEL